MMETTKDGLEEMLINDGWVHAPGEVVEQGASEVDLPGPIEVGATAPEVKKYDPARADAMIAKSEAKMEKLSKWLEEVGVKIVGTLGKNHAGLAMALVLLGGAALAPAQAQDYAISSRMANAQTVSYNTQSGYGNGSSVSSRFASYTEQEQSGSAKKTQSSLSRGEIRDLIRNHAAQLAKVHAESLFKDGTEQTGGEIGTEAAKKAIRKAHDEALRDYINRELKLTAKDKWYRTEYDVRFKSRYSQSADGKVTSVNISNIEFK